MPPHAEKEIFIDKIKRSGLPDWQKELTDRDSKRALIQYFEKDSEDVENNKKTEEARNALISKEVRRHEEELKEAREYQMYLEMIQIRAAQQHEAEEEQRRKAKAASETPQDVTKFVEQFKSDEMERNIISKPTQKEEKAAPQGGIEPEPTLVTSHKQSESDEPLKVAVVALNSSSVSSSNQKNQFPDLRVKQQGAKGTQSTQNTFER